MTSRSYARNTIRPEMTVRQVAADFPSSQDIFRKYGERQSAPAKFGHLEPLTHFARRQQIPLEALLSELAAATGATIERGGRYAERVHHGFILSALVITLTLGAGWGAWLLWDIARQGQFEAVPAAYVVAHGEAQLWGFVGLFVIGISLRTVLQGAIRRRLGRWISGGLLVLALVGVGCGVLWSLWPEALTSLGILSGLALLAMSLVLWSLQIETLRTKWTVTWARAVMVSGLWLVAWAIATLCFRWGVGDAGPGAYSSHQRLLLIEVAVFGFAMNSIYGFGQMLLPGLLRISNVRTRAIEWAHWLHNAGALAICAATSASVGRSATVVGSGLLVAGAVLFAAGNRGFVGRRRTSYRLEQGHASLDLYPPLAFFWLLASLALMTGGVLFESVLQTKLQNAYMGAVRHALTVGFMTTLILGVAQRLLPVLDRTVLAMPRLVVPILVLIGGGNLLRVGSELAILATPEAFRIMPFSSILEWLALLLFTLTATATMFHVDPLRKRGRITGRSSLALLLAEYPWIEDRLRTGRAGYLERTRSVPDELTIDSFAQSEGYDAVEFVEKINTWLADAKPSGS